MYSKCRGVPNFSDFYNNGLKPRIFQTVESGEEAKMEPTVSEQPQIEQPCPAIPPTEIPTDQVIAEQQPCQQGKP